MNEKAALLIPLFGMIFLTFGIMFWMLKLRYRAVLRDGLDATYFRLYNNVEVPEYLQKVTQHYQNLLEMPALFYLAIVLLLILNLSDMLYVLLAWGYLISRLVHSYIHTTSNRLMWRKNSFISSMVVLLIIWLRITLDVIGL